MGAKSRTKRIVEKAIKKAPGAAINVASAAVIALVAGENPTTAGGAEAARQGSKAVRYAAKKLTEKSPSGSE